MITDSDEDVEVVNSFSLEDFYKRSRQLFHNDLTDFVRFTLCGIDPDGDFVLDPIRNAMKDSESFIVTRDYDSLLGISENIDVSSYVTVHTLSRNEDSLSRNVHLTYDFQSSRGTFTEYLHKVPNICLGTWGPHNHLLRVFIPELYDPDRPYSLLSQAQQKMFYEKGLRPAIADILSIEALEWPANYNDEFWRSRGRNGQLRFLTKVVPSEQVPNLANAIREAFQVRDIPWHHGLVILHQIRGVKHATSHEATQRSGRTALRKFFTENDLIIANVPNGIWFIDVALNVTSDNGRCYAWRTDAHFHLVRNALQLSDAVAAKVTSPGSSKYTRDMTSHLTAVSGWRLAPGVRSRGPFECFYYQGYTTDKALTSRAEKGHHGKFVTCGDVLDGKAVDWAQNLFDLNRNAIETNLSTARMEMRIPLDSSLDVFLNVDNALIRESIVSVDPVAWWGLRSYRIKACQLLFKWHVEGDTDLRTTPLALLLVAALVWLSNGLHSAPDKGANSKRLMDIVLPHVSRVDANPDLLAYGTPTKDDDLDSEMSTDEETLWPTRRRRIEGETLPGYPQGMVFFKRICCGPEHPVPRFQKTASIFHPKAFRYFFGTTEADIQADLLAAKTCRPSNPDRIANKTKRTTIYFNLAELEAEANDDEPLPLLFHLGEEGLRLEDRPVDRGEDVQGDTDFEERNGLIKDDIDEALTEVFRQFILDITAKAPNSSGANNPSHLSIDHEARRHVTEDTYKNHNLAAYFRDCQWKIATPQEWGEIFDRLWPQKGFVLTGTWLQNFKQVTYFGYWRGMLDRADEMTAIRMRFELKKKFDEFYFMPWVHCDRIWKSMYKASFYKSSGIDRRQPCPLVAICPGKGSPQWNAS